MTLERPTARPLDSAPLTRPAAPPLPEPDEVRALFDGLKNWGRWGADDEHGTLNLIGEAERVRAAGLVSSGVTVSLAHDIATEASPDTPRPASHQMLASGADLDCSGIAGYQATRDTFTTDVHGMRITHLDALCHMFVDGQSFNGRGPETVTAAGAEAGSVMTTAEGIVGRGVLLDVPAAFGVEFLDPSERITVADLELAEKRQRSPIGKGDLLIISTGRDARTAHLEGTVDPFSDGLAGLHPECLPWLRERDVAVLGSDGISDAMPASPVERWPFPIHQVGIVSIGLILLDNLRLDVLSDRCAREQRWEFLLHVSTLRIPGATGCPVNPIATF